MPDLLDLIGPRSGGAPLVYTVSELGVVELQTAFAHFDGTGASGSWRPALTIRSQNGTLLARVFPSDSMAIGDTADVTYSPFVPAASGGGGGGGSFNLPPFASGKFYGGQFMSTPAGASAAANNEIMATPLQVPTTTTFDQLACFVMAARAATSVRMGIYSDNGSGYPNALLVDAGSTLTTSGGTKALTISLTLTAGLYWTCLKFEQAPSASVLGYFGGIGIPVATGSLAGYTLGTGPTNYDVVDAGVPLPATFPAGGTPTTTALPAIAFVHVA